MQQSRRTTPYPFTWELPLGAVIAVLVVLVLVAQAARTLANGLTTGHWQATPREELFTSLPAVLGGDSTAGLTGAADGASPAVLWTVTALAEVAALLAVAWAIRWTVHRWGPGRIHGMATAAEAEQLLGRSRLRKSAPIIRPDLHPTKAKGDHR